MDKMLSNIAFAMSTEATKVLEVMVNIPQSAIVKVPTWDNCTDMDMYVCKYQYYAIIACVENGTVTEVKVVG